MNFVSYYIINLGGEYEDTEKSMASMFQAFGLAIFLIYIIITCTFKSFIQPFMLMFTIPLAVMGVFVGLIIMRTPIGMMSFMGIIALSGIVVNDSIILITVYQELRTNGKNVSEAIIQAATSRLRAVILTSLTTTIGFLCLLTGKVPPFRHLGIVAALGTVVAFLLSFTFNTNNIP